MKLIVGLGNPGKKYEQTRHNVGFEVLERLAKRFGDGAPRGKFDGQTIEATIAGERTLLLCPHTFMNRSGRSVQAAVAFYKFDLAEVLVVCDDFNLPLGKIRFRPSGSAGGQNGLDDIVRSLGSEEFARLRIGIGPVPERWNPADFVLARFTADDRLTIDATLDKAADGVGCWLANGIEESMNQYNRAHPPHDSE